MKLIFVYKKLLNLNLLQKFIILVWHSTSKTNIEQEHHHNSRTHKKKENYKQNVYVVVAAASDKFEYNYTEEKRFEFSKLWCWFELFLSLTKNTQILSKAEKLFFYQQQTINQNLNQSLENLNLFSSFIFRCCS